MAFDAFDTVFFAHFAKHARAAKCNFITERLTFSMVVVGVSGQSSMVDGRGQWSVASVLILCIIIMTVVIVASATAYSVLKDHFLGFSIWSVYFRFSCVSEKATCRLTTWACFDGVLMLTLKRTDVRLERKQEWIRFATFLAKLNWIVA